MSKLTKVSTKEEVRELYEQGVSMSTLDVTEIRDASNMFTNYETFNDDISKWNTSNFTNMNSMFFNCHKFNQDLSKWDISNVETMGGMFNNCHNFNQDLSKWDISQFNSENEMFKECTKMLDKNLPQGYVA